MNIDGSDLLAETRGSISLPVTIDGPISVLDVSSITSIDRSDVSAKGGAYVAFPGVSSYSGSDQCLTDRLQVNDPGSVLDLSNFTQLDHSDCGSLRLEANGGGWLDLSDIDLIGSFPDLRTSGVDSIISVRSLNLTTGARISGTDGGWIEVAGGVSYQTTNSCSFSWSQDATLSMIGSGDRACEILEVGSEDSGLDPAGFGENFHLEVLRIGPGTRVRLVDFQDNGNRGGSGGIHEVLYVEKIVFVDATGFLLTGPRHLYYNSLIGNTSQIVVTSEYASFEAELAGPDVSVICSLFDSDGDGDVDLKYFADYNNSFQTP